MNQYEIAVISAVGGALVGAFITHRFQIGRDKRKEINEVSAPLYEMLCRAINMNNPSGYPDKLDLELFIQYLPWHKKSAYKLAVDALMSSLDADRNAKSWDKDLGEYVPNQNYESLTKKHAEKILPYLQRR